MNCKAALPNQNAGEVKMEPGKMSLETGLDVFEEASDDPFAEPTGALSLDSKNDLLEFEVEVEQDVLELDFGGSLDPEKQESVDVHTTGQNGSTTTATDQKAEKDPQKEKTGDTKEKKCLWISNLATETRTADLKTIFGNFGKVLNAKVISSSSKDGNRFYGFITMQNCEEAQACIDNLAGSEIHGKVISIENVAEQPKRRSDKTESKPKSTDKISTDKPSDSFSSKIIQEHGSRDKGKESRSDKEKRSTSRGDSHSHRVGADDARRKLEQLGKMRGDERKRSQGRTERTSRESSRGHQRPPVVRRTPPPPSRTIIIQPKRDSSHYQSRPRESHRVSPRRRSRSRSRRRGEGIELRNMLDNRNPSRDDRERDRLIREREEQMLLREREERRLEEERHKLIKEKLEREKIVKERLELQRQMLLLEKERQIAEQKLLKEAEELKRLTRAPRGHQVASSSRNDDRRRRQSTERDRSPDKSKRDSKYSRVESSRNRDRDERDSRTNGHRGEPSKDRRVRAPSPRREKTPPRKMAIKRVLTPPPRDTDERYRSGDKVRERSPGLSYGSVQRSVADAHLAAAMSRDHMTRVQQPMLGGRDFDLRQTATTVQESRTRMVHAEDRPRPSIQTAANAINQALVLPPTGLGLLDPRQFYQNPNPVPHVEFNHVQAFPDLSYGSSHRSSSRNAPMR